MRPVHRILLGLGIAGGVALWTVIVFAVAVTADAGRGGFSSKTVAASMEPALLSGDYFTSRLLRYDMPIARGSLVEFLFPLDTSKHFVKRAIGLPGDTIEMRGGGLLLNAHPIVEQYAWHSDSIVPPGASTDTMLADAFAWQEAFRLERRSAYHPSRNDWGPLVLPPLKYFVLGDNRDNSLDSRYYGFVDRDAIFAAPRRVYFSSDPTSHRIRWSRLGTLLH